MDDRDAIAKAFWQTENDWNTVLILITKSQDHLIPTHMMSWASSWVSAGGNTSSLMEHCDRYFEEAYFAHGGTGYPPKFTQLKREYFENAREPASQTSTPSAAQTSTSPKSGAISAGLILLGMLFVLAILFAR
ncbi:MULTISPECIES: hypothetical protein [unclassified Bradyrhizobium]|uniref:hypothetical protein n=1 Tax=unclassified Bradyrhizobium TaxID=2631580 RepID=UPI001CD34166|nr:MULTISPECIES: hypothetical protein [unclassified Bradyrhizobium]MCA1382684.1 hypothetical protein [Bradyrhizobium sp. BRP05]MCA1421791.1 hypothetical protein [Bradyrhizobium sp. BRP23]MCA1434648.1 hypothetical protein [Bradyrhizobium sp. BRP20]